MDDRIKAGVDLSKLAPQWGVAYPMIQYIFHEFGYACVITSGNDGQHMPTSLHYSGKALDFRTKHMAVVDKAPVRNAIKAALGEHWDVILEAVGQANEHAHIEYDVKENAG